MPRASLLTHAGCVHRYAAGQISAAELQQLIDADLKCVPHPTGFVVGVRVLATGHVCCVTRRYQVSVLEPPRTRHIAKYGRSQVVAALASRAHVGCALHCRRGSNTKAGALTKRGQKVKTWKLRWFSMHDGKLEYYDCEGGTLKGATA